VHDGIEIFGAARVRLAKLVIEVPGGCSGGFGGVRSFLWRAGDAVEDGGFGIWRGVFAQPLQVAEGTVITAAVAGFVAVEHLDGVGFAGSNHFDDQVGFSGAEMLPIVVLIFGESDHTIAWVYADLDSMSAFPVDILPNRTSMARLSPKVIALERVSPQQIAGRRCEVRDGVPRWWLAYQEWLQRVALPIMKGTYGAWRAGSVTCKRFWDGTPAEARRSIFQTGEEAGFWCFQHCGWKNRFRIPGCLDQALTSSIRATGPNRRSGRGPMKPLSTTSE